MDNSARARLLLQRLVYIPLANIAELPAILADAQRRYAYVSQVAAHQIPFRTRGDSYVPAFADRRAAVRIEGEYNVNFPYAAIGSKGGKS